MEQQTVVPKLKRHYKIDKKSFFYPSDFQKVLDRCNPHQTFTLKFLINTGARINEARHVDEKDLDKDRRNVLLRITKVRAKLKETRPSPRNIPVSTKYFKYLKKNINEYNIHSTSAARKFIQKLSKEAGINYWEDLSAHNLRKTFGTWMLSLGVDGFKLAQHLGHDPNTLIREYASPDLFNNDDKDRMREVLDDLPSRLRN